MKEAYIYGRNAIMEALNGNTALTKIYIMNGAQGPAINSVYGKAKKDRVPIVIYDKRKFIDLEKAVCPRGEKTQGIIALRELVETLSVKELIDIAKQKPEPVIVILDEMSDPHNLGAIARSAECSGAAGVIMTERNAAPINPVSIKASAGALEHIPVCQVSNLPDALIKLKEAGFWIVGTDAQGDRDYTADIYSGPIGLVIGSEGKGMRPGVIKQCDFMVKMPIMGKVTSLNASVSAGVMLYEILRQRIAKKGE